MPYDPDRHHRRTVRLRGHDYTAGTYFLTICAHRRESLFGHVAAGRMIPNAAGTVILDEWRRSAAIRREIDLVAVALMPNHLHGLVVLDPDLDGATPRRRLEPAPVVDGVRDSDACSRDRAARERSPRSLGAFVGGFKAASTSRVNAHIGTTDMPVWQRGFHDHLVRHDRAMVNIANYILTNPLRWQLDPENPDRAGEDPFDDRLLADRPTP